MATDYKLYSYRWVVLGVFMFINLTIQMLWIAYAPITGPAAAFYGATDLKIGLLAMTFMIAFIPLSIPVSWVIDTYGFKIAVSIGAVLMTVLPQVLPILGLTSVIAAPVQQVVLGFVLIIIVLTRPGGLVTSDRWLEPRWRRLANGDVVRSSLEARGDS